MLDHQPVLSVNANRDIDRGTEVKHPLDLANNDVRRLDRVGEAQPLGPHDKLRGVRIDRGPRRPKDPAAQVKARDAIGIALVRMEQFYPFPENDLRDVIAQHPGAELVWIQDEPENQGAWPFIALELRRLGIDVRVISRNASASPAVGSSKRSAEEHASIMDDAFAEL